MKTKISRIKEPVKVLSADEAAKFLHVSKKAIYEMASRGQINSAMIAGRYKFRESELIKFLEEQEEIHTTEARLRFKPWERFVK